MCRRVQVGKLKYLCHFIVLLNGCKKKFIKTININPKERKQTSYERVERIYFNVNILGIDIIVKSLKCVHVFVFKQCAIYHEMSKFLLRIASYVIEMFMRRIIIVHMKQNNYRTARNSQTRQTERVTKTDYIPKHNSKGLVNKSSKNKPAFESYLPPRQS